MAGEAIADRGTGAKTLAAMAAEAVERFDGTALKYHEDGDWRELSYEELGIAARGVAGGLVDLGIEAGQRVAIFSDTRAEWTVADLGAILAGAVVVPIYQTSSAEEARHVLEDSESVLVFCEDGEKLATAREASEGLGVETFVLFEGDDDDAISFRDLADRGSDHEPAVKERAEAVSPDDVFTLVYTSGTTGAPKGCVLTHGNFRADLDMLESAVDLGDEVVLFLFLPLAHVLSRMAQMLTLDVGGTLAFWRRDMKKAMDDMREIEPTHFPAVPRVFEKIYEEARSRASGAIKEKVFEKAVDVGRQVRELERQGEKPGFVLQKEYDLADAQILSNVRELFGSRLEFALTGAAPVAKEMLEFFDACGVLILEGYGATETSAVTAANRPDDYRFGTVGKAMDGAEIRISDDSDDDGRGEILVKGPHVFQGYHGLEKETDEAFEDGWFKTGDLGTIDDDGFLSISGRAKEIIVTSSGKNITPTNIEAKIAESDVVEQAVVIGDDRPYLVALVQVTDEKPDPDDEDLRGKVQDAVDSANGDVSKIEQVKKFAILDRPLSQEEGELTPTMKIKREQVAENFGEQIDALYDGDDD
ncbi:MAG TPA: long-chain fatty acid--CoA ligase [Thermoleophilaceae bacterium]|nr:long-chain fatty acid--CoA ligase [Thermoleophilaceae bacterium]